MQHSHQILGVPSGASDAQIKTAYRRLALTKHPDVGGDPDAWLEIETAYRNLIGSKRTGTVRQIDGRILHLNRMTPAQIQSEIKTAMREIDEQKKQLASIDVRTKTWDPLDERIPKMRKVHEDRILKAESVVAQLS